MTTNDIGMPPSDAGPAARSIERRPAASTLGLLALTIAPLAIWLVPFLNRARIGPFYVIGRVDPSYGYLLNSLLVSCGMNPRQIDHPGTPLQIVGALVVAAMRTLRGQSPFCPVDDVLTRPETYLAGISIVLQLAVAVLAAAVAMRLYRITGDIFAAGVMQACILISPTIAGALGALGTEILAIPAILALGLALLPLATGSWPERPRDSIVAGVILGFAIATKLTVAPLILYVFLFESTKSKLKFVGASVGSFIFWTLPIANMYGKLVRWIVSLAIHSGRYGEGSVGMPSPAAMASTALDLVSQNVPIFLFACLGVLFAVWQRYSHPRLSPSARFAMLSFCVLMVQLVMTVKHPAPHYMIPALVAVAISNGVAVAALGMMRRGLSAICLAALLAMGIGPALSNFRYFDSFLPDRYAQEQRDLSEIQRIADQRCGSLIPHSGGVSTTLSALRFGNAFAEKFDRALARLYPDFIFYSPGDKFYRFTGRDGTPPPVDPGGRPVCVFGEAELPTADAEKFRLIATQGPYRLYEMAR
jgi:hypothetical protein